MRIANLIEAVNQLRPFLFQFMVEEGYFTSEKPTPRDYFLCPNPNHRDTSPSAHILHHGKKGYCHGCSKAFDIVMLNHWKNSVPISGIGFITNNLMPLCKRFGVPLEVGDLTEEDKFKIDVYNANRIAADYIVHQRWSDTLRTYVESRGLTVEKCRELSIGVCPSYDAFEAHMKQYYTNVFLREASFLRPGVFGPNNIIFSIKDTGGSTVGFIARDLKFEEKFKSWEEKGRLGAPPRKYDSSSESNHVYVKRELLFGFSDFLTSRGDEDTLYVVEGQFDWAILKANDFNNCIALSGKALTPTHLESLRQHKIKHIVLVLDGDRSGREGVQTLLLGQKDKPGILSTVTFCKISVVELPDGEDPNSFVIRNGIQAFKDLPVVDSFSWALNNQEPDQDPVKTCEVMIPFIMMEPNFVRREQLIRALADVTGHSFKAIEDEILRREDITAAQTEREIEAIAADALRQLQHGDAKATHVLRQALERAEELDRVNAGDPLSIDETVAALDLQIETEAKLDGPSGFRFLRLNNLQVALNGDMNGTVNAIGGVPNTGKCLAEGTQVLLSDGRYVAIESLKETWSQNQIVTWNGYSLVPSPIAAFYDSGQKPGVRVQTSFGHDITTTLVHKYLVYNGTEIMWKQVSDIDQDMDLLAVAANTSCTFTKTANISNAEIRMLAYLLAEGGCSDGTGCRITSNDQVIRDRFIADGQTVFGEEMSYRIDAHDNRTPTVYLTVPSLRGSSNHPITQWMKKFGLYGKTAQTKELPAICNDFSREQACLFLSSFIDCDGWITISKQFSLGIALASKILVKQLQQMFLKLGYIGRFRYKPVRLNDQIFDSYLFEITTKFYLDKMIVDFESDLLVKKNHFSFWQNSDRSVRDYYQTYRSGDLLFVPISSIEPIGSVHMYDLTVDGTHCFVANDVLAHNTALQSQLGKELVTCNDDTIVIIHTIDDNRIQMNRRLAVQFAIDEAIRLGMPIADKLTLNKMANPKFYMDQYPVENAGLMDIREFGYNKLRDLLLSGRLIIKDMTHGATIEFLEKMVKRAVAEHPGKKIVAILDNFHKTQDFSSQDERTATKRKSQYLKTNIAQGYGVTVFSTFEYKKIEPGVRPTNNDLREAVNIEYDINYLEHLYSPLNAAFNIGQEEKCLLWHGHPFNKLPIIEGDIGKNKVTEVRNIRHYYKFYPAQSRYETISPDEAQAIVESNRVDTAREEGKAVTWVNGKKVPVSAKSETSPLLEEVPF